MKLLHSADLHLDTPFSGRSDEEARFLRRELRKVPGLLADLCRRESCDLVLLSGDLFDGAYTRESLDALRNALAQMRVPVFISPGNHDFCAGNSPYLTEVFPENVHIFANTSMDSAVLPELSCRIYGAGFSSMDAPALLEGFRAECRERYAIGILHGDPTNAASPCCPVTRSQVQESGLDYLALGHIHKGGAFRAGSTLCAWPGCPMGRGWDETGIKGALIVTLEETADARFVPLDTPRFFTPEAEIPQLRQVLPPAPTEDFYRVTLVGESGSPDMGSLRAQFSHIPHLQLRDQTTPPFDLWEGARDDNLTGVMLRILQEQLAASDPENQETIRLAAKLTRQIVSGQEVVLP